jgi:hypothetical protein
VVQVSAEHPKRGVEDYEGVPLQRLIALTAPLEAAKTVVLTAADGYSTSIDLAAVLACEECLVAFTDTEGSYNLAMPGFESSAWVKDIAKIEVQ